MFTGIVGKMGKVLKTERKKGGLRLRVAKPAAWRAHPGESVNVNGVCSTVTRSGPGLEFDYMPETLACTNLEFLHKGAEVNLERSLRPTDFLSGHLVQGHVDATGKIRKITSEGNSRILDITFPPIYRKLVSPKGSIAVEGISLTLARVGRDAFTVKVVPYTWAHTNLRFKQNGDTVNLEFDAIAKYVAHFLTS